MIWTEEKSSGYIREKENNGGMFMRKPAKRLSKKDLDSVLQVMRRWPDMQRVEVAKLVFHCEWQRQEIERLENELYELKQKDFFRNQDKINESINDPRPSPEVAPKVFSPLRERLYKMACEGQKGSDLWNLTLKWNRLTEAKALSLVEEYKAEKVA